MNYSTRSNALNQYRQVNVHGSVPEASPYQLVQLLFQGGLDRLATAKACIAENDIAAKARNITKALNIIGELRGSLDLEAGGELAANLDNLYEYMGRRLVEANLHSDVAILNEVSSLLGEIKSAWEAIPADQREPRR